MRTPKVLLSAAALIVAACGGGRDDGAKRRRQQQAREALRLDQVWIMQTLAPEPRGAHMLIDELVARGITVSCGHSDATAAEAHLAFDRGAHTVTGAR